MSGGLHHPVYALFVALLRQSRKTLNVYQEELARRLGVPQSYVSKVETGARRIDVVELLCWLDALEVDPETFVRELHQQMQSRQILHNLACGDVSGLDGR